MKFKLLCLLLSWSIALAGEEGTLWSLKPLQKSKIPEMSGNADPIDAFIHAKLDAVGLRSFPQTDRLTLIRRLHFDLLGLPPTPQAVKRFLQDKRPDAYLRLITHLLESPHFGERWARHWLDLTAYADTVGIGRAIPAPEAWRYRDYVINAFGRDLPYDTFVREQIAGDLIGQVLTAVPEDELPYVPWDAKREAERIIATGFLAIGPWELVNGDKPQLRMDIVDKQVNRVGQTFLGLTLGCARCHEHKFDPVSQEDYFAMAGIFLSTVTLKGRLQGVFSAVNHQKLPETADEVLARSKRLRLLEVEHDKTRKARDKAEGEAKGLEQKVKRLKELITGIPTDEDKNATAKELARLEKQLKTKKDDSKRFNRRLKGWNYLKHHLREPLAMAVEDAPEPEDCRINHDGNARELGKIVPRGFLTEVSWEGQKTSILEGTSGRKELADWVADGKNPLTARVWVNRVWHHLLGAGLVRTVDNFGMRGERPSHPKLLDYLTHEFVNDGWSTKRLIQRIVKSQAYRRGSSTEHTKQPESVSKANRLDPDNRLLWRANRKRLDAESIRDAMLFVSGRLNFRRGGPALPFENPENVVTGGPGSVSIGVKFPDELFARRTIYQPVKRQGPFGAINFLGAFDLPDTNEETGRRTQSTVPEQALYLINSPFVQDCAKALAERFIDLESVKRIKEIYLTMFNRSPTNEERQNALDFIDGLAKEIRIEKNFEGEEVAKMCWTRFCQSLLISNEFLFRN